MGIAGRTGHDYSNGWTEAGHLKWQGKTGTLVDQPQIRAMIAPSALVHIFWRESDRVPFTYAGLGRATEVQDTTPVALAWVFAEQPAPTKGPELELAPDAGRRYWPDHTEQEVAAASAAEASRSRANGQGFASSAEFRKAVEEHAMAMAIHHFRALGYLVEDTSQTRPYDLVATRGDESLYVEVKGTTSAGTDVFLTKNEVAHARSHREQSVLFIVHGISVAAESSGLAARGGVVRLIEPWDVDHGELAALAYTYRVPCAP